MNYKIVLPPALAGAIAIAASIDLTNPENYAGQAIPAYIVKSNMPASNPVTDKGAVLGRVLFYDKQLSANNTIACASCHLQQFAFGDTAFLGRGHLGGVTGRHGMRLVNARFSTEARFFWDERATSLEDQVTRPIKDAVEMGYSGTGGQGDINALISKMNGISYYNILFKYAFGDTIITEARIQQALAQFVRSIQSFDSKFDAGLAQTNNLNAPFPNFTPLENQGKNLFLAPPPQGGAGCQGCHRAPEFDIDPAAGNNGIIGVASLPGNIDLTNTRAPSLRDLFNPGGTLNGPLMHNAAFNNIADVINHYNLVPQNAANTNLDQRLQGPGGNLGLTQVEKDALVAFLHTLTGSAIYTDPKWSNPFDENGNLHLTGVTALNENTLNTSPAAFPNPVQNELHLSLGGSSHFIVVFDNSGKVLLSREASGETTIDVSHIPAGIIHVSVFNAETGRASVRRLIKQ